MPHLVCRILECNNLMEIVIVFWFWMLIAFSCSFLQLLVEVWIHTNLHIDQDISRQYVEHPKYAKLTADVNRIKQNQKQERSKKIQKVRHSVTPCVRPGLALIFDPSSHGPLCFKFFSYLRRARSRKKRRQKCFKVSFTFCVQSLSSLIFCACYVSCEKALPQLFVLRRVFRESFRFTFAATAVAFAKTMLQ